MNENYKNNNNESILLLFGTALTWHYTAGNERLSDTNSSLLKSTVNFICTEFYKVMHVIVSCNGMKV